MSRKHQQQGPVIDDSAEEYSEDEEQELPEDHESQQNDSDSDDSQQADQDGPKGVNYESEQDPQDEVEQKQDTRQQKKKKQVKKEEYVNYYDQMLPPDEEVDKKPPIVVVIQGPRRSGKTTLIRSLVKHYTGYKVQEVKGPISVRVSKHQRITLIECPNNMSSMVDLSKIADYALLLVDASVGFEMQSFQFLSLLKCHGFPTVMGVLTHLDFFKDSKQLRKTKKVYKKRFEYEIGGDSKLFHILGCSNQLYTKRDILNLTRYFYNVKIPRIPWRQHHPYLMADRWELANDNTYQDESLVSVNFYGYIRNSSYRINSRLHLVGFGDFDMQNFQVIEDPCPQVQKSVQKQVDSQPDQRELGEGIANRKKKSSRTLQKSSRMIYAPHCNLGYLNFDKTGNFITIPEHYVKFTEGYKEQEEEDEEGVKLVRDLHNPSATIDRNLQQSSGNIELLEGVELNQQVVKKSEQDQTVQFRKKRHEIGRLKSRTQQLELVNEYGGEAKKTDLYSLIYESKSPLKIIDCSRFHPHLQESYPIKQLFVTGMETDVLKQEDYEEERKKTEPKKPKLRVSIKASTNFIQLSSYVKITVTGIPYKYFKMFVPESPLLLCRINAGEDNLGFLKVRFKRHRWYPNILKSNDPFIVSCGWRRYQSLPVYATEDPNDRLRFLKYTPEHDFCLAVFYGIFSSQNSGCVFFQTLSSTVKKFRIAGTGVILELNKSFDVVKKLKLVGQPYKILKNTSFIKGMFNSALEVANYEGAQIKTVSGIRGQIKKAVKQGHQGTFRATFEDKIRMSDIVFCVTWYKIQLEKLYNPVLVQTRLMKTAYEIRVEKQLSIKVNPDSIYKKIERNPKTFAPLIIPKSLERVLPFASKQKFRESKKQQIQKRENEGIPKIFQSDQDKEVASMIERLNLIRNQKTRLKKEKDQQKFRIRNARENPMKERFEKQKKEHRKEHLKQVSKAKNRGGTRSNKADD